MTENYLLYLYTESPLHAGGPEPDSWIDLPIQRETGTGYPVVWGQSLKGALRAQATSAGWAAPDVNKVFGTASGSEDMPTDTSGGWLSVGDAQLVAMPVPTLQRSFAWVTSELALGRLHRKYRSGSAEADPPAAPELSGPAAGYCLDDAWKHRHQILGPYSVNVDKEPDGGPLAQWAQRIATDGLGGAAEGGAQVSPGPLDFFARRFTEDLVLVNGDVMGGLLRECTEQAVRVSLKPETKTVDKGPFTSEYLPAESVLAATLTLRPRGGDKTDDLSGLLKKLLNDQVIQIGGDETLGKGLTWARLVEVGRG